MGKLLTRTMTRKSQTFTASGTWVKPAGVTTVDVTVVGGGGSGGGGTANGGGNGQWGGGGGGGAVVEAVDVPVTANVTVMVGAGGAGYTPTVATMSESHGLPGGSSQFGSIVAPGGNGASNTVSPVIDGNAGGTASSFVLSGTGAGGAGAAPGWLGSPMINGGYPTAFQTSSGTNPIYQSGIASAVVSPNANFYGHGGAGLKGYGGGGAGANYMGTSSRDGGGSSGTTNPTTGGAGTPNTGGGGGGSVNFSTHTPGGAGGSGVVIVSWWE